MSPYEWLAKLLAVVKSVSRNEVGTDVTIAQLENELAEMSKYDIPKPEVLTDNSSDNEPSVS